MAYPHKGGRGSPGSGFAGASGLLLASLLALTVPTRAEDAAPPGSSQQGQPKQAQSQQGQPQQEQPPALSPSCDAPAGVIAADAPLPHLTKALAEHRSIEILAVGSTPIESMGMSSGVKSYPVQVEDLLKHALKGVNVDVVNRGTGGEVAQTSADRIRSEVALTKPDLVLWQLGTNDALARVDAEQFTDVVTSAIDWLKANDVDVVLVGLQYTTRFNKDANYFAIKDALERIAKSEKVIYVKRYDAMKFIAQTRAKVRLMTSDNYHLSELGTQCMAEHVARAVVANLFVRRFRPSGPAPAPNAPSTSN